MKADRARECLNLAWHVAYVACREYGTDGPRPAASPAAIALARPARKALQREDTADMGDRNVLGGELEPCGADPVTGFYRDGCCTTRPADYATHTTRALVPPPFLDPHPPIANHLS